MIGRSTGGNLARAERSRLGDLCISGKKEEGRDINDPVIPTANTWEFPSVLFRFQE